MEDIDSFTYAPEGAAPDAPTVRVLAIGDPHFRTDSAAVLDLFIDRMCALVDAHRPAFVVVLGDLLHHHERLHTLSMNRAYALVDALRARVPVYVVVGNHDFINNTQHLSDNHWMTGMKEWEGVVVVDRVVTRPSAAGTFVFAPYVFPGRLVEALDAGAEDWRAARALFCHQEFRGCRMGAIVSEAGDLWDPAWPLVVSGHVHDRQRVGGNVFYTGSSMQHAYGESPHKTVALVDVHAGGQVDVRNLPTGMPRKRTVQMNADTFKDFAYTPREHEQLRVTVRGSCADIQSLRKSAQYKKLAKAGVKIVFRPHDTRVTCSSHTSFKDVLFEMVRDHPPWAALYRRFVAE